MDKELRDTIQELGETVEEFKKTNDDRLKKLEKKSGTAEIEEKLKKMDGDIDKLSELKTMLDKLEAKSNRIGITEDISESQEHKKAFYDEFIRKGIDGNVREIQKKSMNVGTPDQGGLAIPEELDRNIISLAKESSAMRRLANSKTVGSTNYKQLVNVRGTNSGWVGETDSRPETDTSKLKEILPYFGEIYANPGATQTSLDDIFFDVEQFIMDEVQDEFNDQESESFLIGDSVNKPKGLLAYAMSTEDDSSRAFGTFQIIKTGVSGDFSAGEDKADIIFDIEDFLKEKYLSNAKWLMKRSSRTKIRKLKDGEGNYLWQPGLKEGQPQTLNGYGIETDGFMPAIGANSNAIAFGDFKKSYTIVDVIGTRMLRNPFINAPYVHFYTTKRVGGFATNTEAVKFINFGE